MEVKYIVQCYYLKLLFVIMASTIKKTAQYSQYVFPNAFKKNCPNFVL